MSRRLQAVCAKCDKTIEAIDVHKTSAERVARLIRDADRCGWQVRLSAEALPFGCECDPESQIGIAPTVRPKFGRVTIRQLLYITTVVAVLLAVFRHPIRLMFDQRVWQAVVSPWSVYAWLF